MGLVKKVELNLSGAPCFILRELKNDNFGRKTFYKSLAEASHDLVNTKLLDALVVVPETLSDYLNDIKDSTENPAVRIPIIVHISQFDYLRKLLLEFELYSAFDKAIDLMIDGCDIPKDIFEPPVKVQRISKEGRLQLFEKMGLQNFPVFILQLSRLKLPQIIFKFSFQSSIRNHSCYDEHEDCTGASNWLSPSNEVVWDDKD